MKEASSARIICGAIDFSAVAGRQNSGFGQPRLIRPQQMLAEIMQRFLKKFRVEGDLLPNGDRRCVMIDAECQQLHNRDYRFDGSINGGKNGVFGFSADWGWIWGCCLDFLPWAIQKCERHSFFNGHRSGIHSCDGELAARSIRRLFSIWTNARVGKRDSRGLHYGDLFHRFS